MTILLTGGSGSIGNKLVDYFLKQKEVDKIIVYSRDEYKHFLMKKRLGFDGYHGEKVRWLVGDVRDIWRLETAMKDVDCVVHCAALKQIPTGEYNPEEFIKTNILGAQNVINASVSKGVMKVIALSTDKSVNALNLYGKTKAVADSLFCNANCYGNTIFALVRYGNVSGSRGSVIPLWREEIKKGNLPVVTDINMTRFWITLDRAVKEIAYALDTAQGGETFIPKMPSYKIIDLASAMARDCLIGKIRPGEKIHEDMILKTDEVYEQPDRYVVYPNVQWKALRDFIRKGDIKYSSDNNENWLSVEDLKNKLKEI